MKCRVDYPDGSHTVTDNLTEDESEAPLTHAVVFLENHRWSVWDGYSDQKDAAEAAQILACTTRFEDVRVVRVTTV